MGMSSGSSSTTSTQPYIMSGLTQAAATGASNAEITAANNAVSAVTANSQNAIQALMGQYSTALQIENPSIQMGNQAAAQMNYMLGLPAVSPGASPTNLGVNPGAAPTAQSLESQVTPQEMAAYVSANTTLNTGIGENGPGSNIDTYTGVSPGGISDANGGGVNFWAPGAYTGGTGKGAGRTTNPGTTDPTFQAAIKLQLAQNLLPAATNTWQQQSDAYTNATQTYNTQQNLWNEQNNLYNTYQGYGTATAANIADIVQNQPGFQFNQQQGMSADQNAATANGSANSGNELQALNQFGQGLSEQYYQNYMANLSTQAGLGQQAQALGAQQSTQLGQNIANVYTNQGTTTANANLAAGQAAASAYTLPVSNQQVIMTPYTTSSNTSSSSDSGSVGGLLSAVSGISGLMPCSKQLKTSYGHVDTKDILDRVNRLTLDKWAYKTTDTPHMGPYAEDFKELFGVGDGQTISVIDMFGVLLSSVKELSLKVKALQEDK